MSVAITLVSGNVSGGTGSDTVTSGDFADAGAAAGAASNGFLVVANPVSSEGKTLKKAAYPVVQIRSIVSL